MAKLCDVPLPLAVRTAVCAALTVDAIAVNDAVVEFAGTITELGNAMAALFVASDTGKPPASAIALSVTLQLSAAAPEIAFEPQIKALTPGVPVPVMFAAEAGSADRLLVIIKGSV